MAKKEDEGLVKVIMAAVSSYRNKGKPADISAADDSVTNSVQPVASLGEATAYRRIAAKSQIQTLVNQALSDAALSPGVTKTKGLSDALCFLCCIGIFGDSEQTNVDRVASCSAAYDSARAFGGNGNALLAEATTMFPVKGPYEIVMEALGNAPRFLAVTNELRNIVPLDSSDAPKGGGLTIDSARGNETPFSGSTPGAQRLMTKNSGGKIIDDATWFAAVDGIPAC